MDKDLTAGNQQEKKKPIKRNEKGQFVKGQSGNPAGRAALPREIMELARASAADAIELAVSYIKDPEMSPRVRMAAANLLLDRAYGKPTQAVDMDVHNGPAVVFTGCDDVPD
jgi:hypothetical protein